MIPARIAIGLLLAGTALPLPAAVLPLIPLPASVTAGQGALTIADGAGIVGSDAGAVRVAGLLAARVKAVRGLTLLPAKTGPIRLVRDAGVAGAEAYVLTVTAQGATVAASADAGLLYGAMTLAQLLSPDAAYGRPVRVAAVTIRDAPRFQWRGLMVDVVRHFQPIGSLYPIVDQLAAHKMNVLHLHLTDDQGWRVEIKRYPKLTEIGAWRTPPSSGGVPGPKVGGFYTQDELRVLVAYAAARGVTIVPEIDLPGHAQAAVAAYPEIGVFGDRPVVSHDYGVNPYLFAPTDTSLAFVKGVLDELIEIFPSTFIHLGGDEAVKDQWQRSPVVQAKMRALGLKTENEMQSWMIDRLGDYLATKGRRMIGWDEILEGGLPKSASVMSWRGEQGAVDAANAGHDVVMSPAPTLYLDSLQSDRADEPPGRLSIQTLADVYAYDPAPKGLPAEKQRHVLGAQGNIWAEYMMSPAQIQHAVFPRLDAIAEMTWSPKAARDFDGFLVRLQPQRLRYVRDGIAAADGAFAVGYAVQGTRGAALRSGMVPLLLATQAGYGTIRYTTDGSVPGAGSQVYAGSLAVKTGTVVRAAAFADGRATAAVRAFDTGRAALLRRTSSEMVACPQGSFGLRVPLTADTVKSAPAYNVNTFDSCTQYPAAPLDLATGFAIDIARLPYRHYGLAHDYKALRQHYAVTTHGELVVRAGGCGGVVAATYPLPDPAGSPNRFTVRGAMPEGMKGDGDICLQFTAGLDQPYYTVEAMTLTERAR